MIDDYSNFFISFLTRNALFILIFTIVSHFATQHWFDPKRKNLPPGPWGIPILGYLPFMPADYGDKIEQLRQKYGRIFSMRLGNKDVVIISDFDVIKKITKLDAYNNRPDRFLTLMLPSFLGNCEYLFIENLTR